MVGGQEIIATLFKKGVLAIGNLSLIQTIFGQYIKSGISPFNVTSSNLRRNRGFVYYIYHQLVMHNFTSHRQLLADGMHRFYLLPSSENKSILLKYGKEQSDVKIPLSEIYHNKVEGLPSFYAHPAFNYQLEYHENNLYFVLRPTFVITTDEKNVLKSREAGIAINVALSGRYNATMDMYLMFWLDYLKKGQANVEIGFPPGAQPPVAKIVLEGNYSYSARSV